MKLISTATVTAILSTLVQATFSNSLVDLGNLGVSPGNSSGGNLEPPGTTRISALADLNGDQLSVPCFSHLAQLTL